jgi:hypothetical protein
LLARAGVLVISAIFLGLVLTSSIQRQSLEFDVIRGILRTAPPSSRTSAAFEKRCR